MNKEIFINECIDIITDVTKPDDICIYSLITIEYERDGIYGEIRIYSMFFGLYNSVEIFINSRLVKEVKVNRKHYLQLKRATVHRLDVLNNKEFYDVFKRTCRNTHIDSIL